MTPDEFLALSDERDQALTRLLATERAAFTRGRAIGRREGYAAGLTHCERQWLEALAPVRAAVRERNPPHAELERRRYGEGGRAHFADPRPDDFTGRDHNAQTAETAA